MTNEDLRFADFICKHTSGGPQVKVSNGDNGDWEGSDDWIRIQINLYLLHLIKTVLISEHGDNGKELIMFGTQFVESWKETENYKKFKSEFMSKLISTRSGNEEPLISHQVIELINSKFGSIKSGHPFGKPSHANQVSSAVADLKLRFAASGYASSLFGAKVTPTSSVVTASPGTEKEVQSVKNAISSAKASITSWYTSTIPTLVPVDNIPASEIGPNIDKDDQTPEKALKRDFQSVSMSKLLERQNDDLDASFEVASDVVTELISDGDEEIFTRSNLVNCDHESDIKP